MTDDEEYKAQIERVEAIIDRWVEPLGLKWWDITTVYDRSGGREQSDGFVTIAQCRARWEYLRAQITVFLGTVKDVDDDDLESHIVHELMHIFLAAWPPDEDGSVDEHEELAATMLARAMRWARKEGYKEGLAAQPECVLAALESV